MFKLSNIRAHFKISVTKEESLENGFSLICFFLKNERQRVLKYSTCDMKIHGVLKSDHY